MPSDACADFIKQASTDKWLDAVKTANGLNMYEMLRAFKALNTSELVSFQTALVGAPVNAPRIYYAIDAVVYNSLDATAPGDLDATGQVNDARQFLARPRSILQEPVPITALAGLFNLGIAQTNNAFMLATLGAPRSSFSQACQPIQNPHLQPRMKTMTVGPFTATGLDSALISLTTVMSNIKRDLRIVYRVLGTAGMLCARFVRGSTTNISNHSWGTAIDLTIGSALDVRGDQQVQFGLQLIAPLFNAQGWFWGMEFPTEDGMHFEGGQALVTRWATP